MRAHRVAGDPNPNLPLTLNPNPNPHQVIKSIEEKRMDMYSDGMRMINEMRQKDNEGKI